ncbi:hypothetical protein CFP65_4043 [Kitasatospora sp. MMS16-BH015]|uniref:DUF6059 family protein n=1 Tax=Kitasatospora sp. MMS16-BH015 TaxID=2018025 RepID=UPI000CA09747|nr:DUF6059 family protein [Kitasatospora sp. MMS16-BH015]AUG78810.1 hypothetical protein CFP65_4043 [Kitasatospora sp. MMS16-BH015]
MSGSRPGSDPGDPVGQSWWRGFVLYGLFHGFADDDLAALVLGLRGPAPGHPERAVPWLPPTPEERDLWARASE